MEIELLPAQQFIVFSMCANPEPQNPIRFFSAQGTIVCTHPNRPQLFALTHFFEMQRRMIWVCFEQFKVFVSQRLNVFWQLRVISPVARQGAMVHSGLLRPASYSLSTSSKNVSRRPVSRSCSICLSHICS